MKALHHPNIALLFDVIDTPESSSLIMVHLSGEDMWEYLQVHGLMMENEVRGIFQQLVSAVHYGHHRNTVHRDLQSKNVLFNSDMNVKLKDFGFSVTENGACSVATPLGQPQDYSWANHVMVFQWTYGIWECCCTGWSLGTVPLREQTGGSGAAGSEWEVCRAILIII